MIVGVSAGDDGGFKVRVNVYTPDAQLAGTMQVGANERQEMGIRMDRPGNFVIQLWNYRAADVPYHVDIRRG